MKFKFNRIWIIAILLGWSFDFLFWKQSSGLNFALFLILCLLGGAGLFLTDGLRPALKSLWLLIPFTFFAVITFTMQEPLTVFLAYTFSLFSLGVLANTYLGGRWMQYGLADYFGKLSRLVGGMFSLPFDYLEKVRKEQATRGEAKTKFPLGAILRGLLIAFPIVAFFASLLASADAIFNQKIADLFVNFDVLAFLESIFRVLIILFFAWIVAGTFIHTAAHSGDQELSNDNPTAHKRFLGFTESAIVLGSVAVLFLIFVVIQFQYFFGGQANIGVEGFTYSQYARRGFSELNTVVFFSLVLILGFSAITRRSNETQRRIHLGLNAALAAEVMVILFSSYQRLMLTIDWHGFSRLRLYPRVFMIWLGVLLVAIVVLEILRRERYFAFAFVLASLGFAISLTLVNVDASIVSYNLERVKQGKNLNVPDLASLSVDAIPALVAGFHDPQMSAEQHEGIGAILTCYLHSNIMTASDDWRSYNFSRWRTRQILETMKPLLEGYRYNDKKFPPLARTPNGMYYECWKASD
jgi:hypothetical protein